MKIYLNFNGMNSIWDQANHLLAKARYFPEIEQKGHRNGKYGKEGEREGGRERSTNT